LLNSPPEHRKQKNEGLIAEYVFTGQRKFFIRGLMACASVSLSVAARLLKMDMNAFSQTFDNADLAIDTLSSCVQAGVDLNEKASHSFVEQLAYKETDQLFHIIEKDQINLGSVNQLGIAEASTPVRTQDNSPIELTLEDYLHHVFSRYKTLNQKDFGFVATHPGHVTSFFIRETMNKETYCYLIDSADEVFSGKMHVYRSPEYGINALLEKWKQYAYVDITAFALKERLELQANLSPKDLPRPKT
jgi:hypothetical protein